MTDAPLEFYEIPGGRIYLVPAWTKTAEGLSVQDADHAVFVPTQAKLARLQGEGASYVLVAPGIAISACVRPDYCLGLTGQSELRYGLLVTTVIGSPEEVAAQLGLEIAE